MQDLENIGKPMKYEHYMSASDFSYISQEARNNFTDEKNYHTVDKFLLEIQEVFLKYGVKKAWLSYKATSNGF